MSSIHLSQCELRLKPTSKKNQKIPGGVWNTWVHQTSISPSSSLRLHELLQADHCWISNIFVYSLIIDCIQRWTLPLHFSPLYKNEAKISWIKPLSSCTCDVIWGQSLCSSDCRSEMQYWGHTDAADSSVMSRAQLSILMGHPLFIASSNSNHLSEKQT